MRVAHVITRMILGGAQENTLLSCRAIARSPDDQVVLITGPAEGPEGSLLLQARQEGIPVVQLPALRRSLHPWHDWRAYRDIRRALSEFRPDVVHTHSAKAGFLGRLAAWSLRVRAIVHTVHGAPYHPYQSRGARALFRACERYAAKRSHKLVSVADAMTELLVGDRVAPREKFITIYSGMEVEPFLQAHLLRDSTRRELGFSPEHLVIGVVARLFHLKGHADVIAAAGPVAARFPAARFLLVGDGILREKLERQIAAAGLADRFRLVGLVSPEQIPRYLAASDLLVHASLREGLARVLPQALITGRPVVSYDIDGAREVVLPGRTGILVPPGDVARLAAAMLELLGDPAMREQFGHTGRELFTERFRHETMTGRLDALYRELLGQGPR